jgi:hypothetical protein
MLIRFAVKFKKIILVLSKITKIISREKMAFFWLLPHQISQKKSAGRIAL